jgi:hypothetical protein
MKIRCWRQNQTRLAPAKLLGNNTRRMHIVIQQEQVNNHDRTNKGESQWLFSLLLKRSRWR